MSKNNAKATVQDNDSGATACLLAMDELLGSTWMAWEPETLWLDLQRRNIAVTVGNREQIMAARNLVTTARFYYDVHAFEKTCMAFNNEEGNYDALDDVPVAYISWAWEEADQIHRKYHQEDSVTADREPLCYIAIQLYREGFVLAPNNLQWVQEQLDTYLPSDSQAKKLQEDVREAWAAAPRGQDLLDAAFPETPEGVQLARLAAVQVHCSQRRKARDQQVAKLLKS